MRIDLYAKRLTSVTTYPAVDLQRERVPYKHMNIPCSKNTGERDVAL